MANLAPFPWNTRHVSHYNRFPFLTNATNFHGRRKTLAMGNPCSCHNSIEDVPLSSQVVKDISLCFTWYPNSSEQSHCSIPFMANSGAQPAAVAITLVSPCIALVFVLLRLYSRYFLTRTLSWDDALIVVPMVRNKSSDCLLNSPTIKANGSAQLLSILMTYVAMVGIYAGYLGYHYNDVPWASYDTAKVAKVCYYLAMPDGPHSPELILASVWIYRATPLQSYSRARQERRSYTTIAPRKHQGRTAGLDPSSSCNQHSHDDCSVLRRHAPVCADSQDLGHIRSRDVYQHRRYVHSHCGVDHFDGCHCCDAAHLGCLWVTDEVEEEDGRGAPAVSRLDVSLLLIYLNPK